MHLFPIATTLALVTFVHRTTSQFTYQGYSTELEAVRQTTGSTEVVALYRSCHMYSGTGTLLAIGPRCVSTLIEYMLKAMASAAAGANVADASSGPSNVQESSSPSSRRQRDLAKPSIVRRINNALGNHPRGLGILRATDVVHSTVHPYDGFATQLNVHGENSTLSVHTNGTHATASFASIPAVDRRDLLPTQYDYFSFSGVDGIKMTAQDMNGTLTPTYIGDLEWFAQAFAGSVNQATGGTSFEGSDSWSYEICNNTGAVPLFYGMIITEEIHPGFDYEGSSLGCDNAGFYTESRQNNPILSGSKRV